MEKLKSVFFHLSMVYWMALAALTAYLIYAVNLNLPTIGMGLVAFIPNGFMLWLFITKKPRTSANQTVLTFSIIIGYALFIIGSLTISWPLIIIYGVGLIFWMLFIFWYSNFPKHSSEVLKIGASLPELTLKTLDNKPFYASSLLGKKAIYLFYRGNWCPVCMAQVKEVASQYKSLKESGAEMILVSPQPQEKTKKLTESLGIDFLFLHDEGNKMAQKLDIAHINGVPIGASPAYGNDTVYPTIVITDEQGKIIFVDQTDNFRIRPEPETYISVLSGHTN